MKPPTYVVLVESEEGDWIAMYLNGRIAHQAHSLEPYSVVKALVGCNVESVDHFTVSLEDIEAMGCQFPINLNEIPQEVRV